MESSFFNGWLERVDRTRLFTMPSKLCGQSTGEVFDGTISDPMLGFNGGLDGVTAHYSICKALPTVSYCQRIILHPPNLPDY